MPVFHVLAVLSITALVSAWDIAVLTKDEIDFFHKGQFMGTVGGRLKELLSATYDPVGGYLFVSDENQKDGSIFRTNLFRSPVEPSIVPFQAIVSNQTTVHGITFDPVSDTLFWTTGNNHSIMKLTMNRPETITSPQPGILVHQFTKEKPHGIAVDSCRRMLYWTNILHPQATIERSMLDGSGKEVIIHENLHQPYSIEVDVRQKKIYWCDSVDSGYLYRIERANLDGTERQVVIKGVDRNPYAITIGLDSLYWTDWHQKMVLSLAKNTTGGGVEPVVVKKYQKDVGGLVSNLLFLSVDTSECAALSPFVEKITDNFVKEVKILQNSPSESIDTNEVETSRLCLNNGTLVAGVCMCPKGFEGVHCELPVCQNYCLGKAVCVVDDKSLKPTCRCPRGWTGVRCERDRCLGVCLNGGRCSLDEREQTVCQCAAGYHGARCEYLTSLLDELCRPLCQNQLRPAKPTQAVETTRYQGSILSIVEVEKEAPQMCRCSEIATTVTNVDAEEATVPKPDPLARTELDSRLNVVLISSLVVVCAILGAFVVFLTIRQVTQRKRPRIRKRIVVNKPTPFPCIPDQPSREQCEITIENCCNMNICETPCFEPEFKSSRATFKKKKSEDKRTLIHAMHTNSSQEDD